MRHEKAELRRSRIESVMRENGKDAKTSDIRSALLLEGIKLHDSEYYPMRRKMFGLKKKVKASTKSLKNELSSGIAAMELKRRIAPGSVEPAVSIDDLRQIKDIADRIGGIGQLSSVVSMISELAS